MSSEAEELGKALGGIAVELVKVGKSVSEKRIAALESALTAETKRREEAERKTSGYRLECHAVEQIIGRALGYPKYPNDSSDQVCIGDHSPASIASEAANKIDTLRTDNVRLRKALKFYFEAMGH